MRISFILLTITTLLFAQEEQPVMDVQSSPNEGQELDVQNVPYEEQELEAQKVPNEEQGLEVQGSLYTEFSVPQWFVPHNQDSAHVVGANVFKFNFKNRNRTFAKVDGAFELSMPYGYGMSRYSDTSSSPLDSAYRATTQEFIILSGDQMALLLDIRRLYAELYFQQVDITLGRKLIDFGKGRIFSPIDKFSVIDVTDYTYRRNASDIAMVTVHFNAEWGANVVTELPYENQENTTALKLFGTAGSFDLNAVGMYRHQSEQAIAGGAFQGDAFLGIYGEMLYTFPTKTLQGYGDAMLGLDYSITNSWLFVAEYLYAGHPTPTTWDTHSLFLMAQYSINELMSTSANIAHNFTDNTSIATGYWTYNILQNVDLITYVQWQETHLALIEDLKYALRVEVKF